MRVAVTSDDEVMLQVKLPYGLLEEMDRERKRIGVSRRGLITMLIDGYVKGRIRVLVEGVTIDASRG